MSDQSVILSQFPLGFQWPTQEPFLFCVHHEDHYPKGNGSFGVAKEFLSGRDIGQDFIQKDGFRMYHGDDIPGFPVHPHRGFETITIVRKGYVDHADSMGAAGRYGEGDVQWMTAGSGVQHSEMFPLLKTDSENQAELFQIWLNLPRKSKMVSPAFKMFWNEKIPKVETCGGKAKITVIAGEFENIKALSPPSDSWAGDLNNDVMILILKLEPGAEVTLPITKKEIGRSVYFFSGKKISINGKEILGNTGVKMSSSLSTQVKAVDGPCELLLLQAQPMGEPVVQYGPFVMNTKAEISQTLADYQRTHFGGWSWERDDMVHGSKIERFAKYPDGHIEKPENIILKR